MEGLPRLMSTVFSVIMAIGPLTLLMTILGIINACTSLRFFVPLMHALPFWDRHPRILSYMIMKGHMQCLHLNGPTDYASNSSFV